MASLGIERRNQLQVAGSSNMHVGDAPMFPLPPPTRQQPASDSVVPQVA